jgi:DNA mismatch endonuclease (patch repair protein)
MTSRSEMMSNVRARDTKLELKVRDILDSLGYTYSVHDNTLPGKPDIILQEKRIVIFVNGCFWHQHDCKKGKVKPKTNTEFWNEKLARNMERDQKNIHLLNEAGWRVLVIWECEIKKQENLVQKISLALQNNKDFLS